MTDKELIGALRHCASCPDGGCIGCPGEAACDESTGKAVFLAADRLAELARAMTPEEVERTKLSLMGKGLAEITEFDGIPLSRLRELAEADKEGRVLITAPKSDPMTCGDCKNFERLSGRNSGTCKVHYYCKNRRGQIEEWRGRFTPSQSHKGCKQHEPRGSGESVKGG